MMLTCLLFLLLFTDATLSECTYRDIAHNLSLTKKKDLWNIIQPIKNISQPLELKLDVLLYAILDMNEKDQLFGSYIWVDQMWRDDVLRWDPRDFCDIEKIHIPTKNVWIPDLTITEMTEKDKAAQTPYLMVMFDGKVWLRNDMVVVSSCSMHVYKFPFDTQKCNLTFKSIIYSDKQIKLSQVAYTNRARITEWSRKVMQSKAEWEFIDMTFAEKTEDNFGIIQSMVVYTITMKRRPVLYIVNFILPVLLLLCLDLTSLMMPEDSGKVGFKVSVLLAVILMQLLLNEILPSSSNRIPLIVIYCIGIFGLLMLSLMETILVMFLMGIDTAVKEKKADIRSLSEECEENEGSPKRCGCFRDIELIPCASSSNWSSGETSSDLLQAENGVGPKEQTEAAQENDTTMVKALSLIRNMLAATDSVGYWTRFARRLHQVFIVIYIMIISFFIIFMFYSWTNE